MLMECGTEMEYQSGIDQVSIEGKSRVLMEGVDWHFTMPRLAFYREPSICKQCSLPLHLNLSIYSLEIKENMQLLIFPTNFLKGSNLSGYLFYGF